MVSWAVLRIPSYHYRCGDPIPGNPRYYHELGGSLLEILAIVIGSCAMFLEIPTIVKYVVAPGNRNHSYCHGLGRSFPRNPRSYSCALHLDILFEWD